MPYLWDLLGRDRSIFFFLLKKSWQSRVCNICWSFSCPVLSHWTGPFFPRNLLPTLSLLVCDPLSFIGVAFLTWIGGKGNNLSVATALKK